MTAFRLVVAGIALAVLALDVLALFRDPAWLRPRAVSTLCGHLFFAASGALWLRGF